METGVEQALQILPSELSDAVRRTYDRSRAPLEELRLRVGCPVSVVAQGKEWSLSDERGLIYADGVMLQRIISRAAEHSMYSAEEKLKQGFLTLPGGHRLGICGSAVMKQGKIAALHEFTALNLRIARQVRGCADAVSRCVWQQPDSTLLLGPPGCGKTTVLRDLIRQMSDRYRFRVGLIDERGELAACLNGVPQFSVGACTDVLTGCSKEQGILLLLRAMRPDWIALDEISAERDVEAICRASYCGVRFLATAHAWSRDDLRRRPVYRRLLESGVFQNLALMDSSRRIHFERIDND